ncbi:ThiF family adenylyltransferase [Uliginosibacterium sp. H3]|uniref:ThiF family adenylyltransferase n=1 Tax=Uliginosibacterium silvisoli TaxID=3114758 RepID=A0ABU6K5X2_9RHOO|nr:ThiF family adenylyltransferase [Uliginosibacterium sp. H3]
MPELSRGQELALLQISDIAANSNGALEIIKLVDESKSEGYIWVRLSLETKEYRTGNGVAFRDRERISLHISPAFPFKRPEIFFGHKRFIGTPHVQWGDYICLYQSEETEYDPSDGMFGFFDRVEIWMRAAGKGELDPDDAPLHPPVAYTTSSTTFVARSNTPNALPQDGIWIGRADLRRVRDNRFDIVGWTHLNDWGDTEPGHPIAATILFNKPLASEYPTKVHDLINLVEQAGLSFGLLYSLLKVFSLVGTDEEHAYFVLGAPMRRKAAGEPLKPHLTVWEISPETLRSLRRIVGSKGDDDVARQELAKWMANADTSWCDVLEDRPEIVNRRDTGTLLAGLTDKRIILFGCGALGSAVAEMAIRSGASRLHIVDSGKVKPGILVRQRYSDGDIGLNKASALHVRLKAIGLKCDVTSSGDSLTLQALSRFDHSQWDLVIDATASVKVTHRLELELKTQDLPIPMLSMAVSAAAENGSILVRMPKFGGGPHYIARQAKLQAFAKDADHSLVKAFWPERETLKVFQPEPGCSAPTFIGSVADIDYHAAGLLNVGLSRLGSLEQDSASLDLIAASWLQMGDRRRSMLSYTLQSYARYDEQLHGYTVLRSEIAALDMTGELKRIARTLSDRIETGGLIFGEIDDAHRVVWVDSLSGPPPDSTASETQFLCGTVGTTELNEFKSKTSGRSSRFIGIWHTHPVSRGSPSQDDLRAMLALLHFQNSPPRQVVMLIVGHAATRREESYFLYRRNEFALILRREIQDGGQQ